MGWLAPWLRALLKIGVGISRKVIQEKKQLTPPPSHSLSPPSFRIAVLAQIKGWIKPHQCPMIKSVQACPVLVPISVIYQSFMSLSLQVSVKISLITPLPSACHWCCLFFHTLLSIIASLCNTVIKSELKNTLWAILNCYNIFHLLGKLLDL